MAGVVLVAALTVAVPAFGSAHGAAKHAKTGPALFCPVATAATWHDAIPGSKVIIYAETGHIPMEELADQTALDVRKFLSGGKDK